VSSLPAAPPRPDARLAPRELAAWRGLLRVHAALVRRLDAELQEAHGLPLSSYEVLMLLADAPEGRLRMFELADGVLLSLSGMTRLVDRLTREGLVRRERCADDRRGAFAVITPAGRAKVGAARPTHLAGVRRMFLDPLPDPALDDLAAAWERVLPGSAS
jgi:DNA-binding MarR family transcriptional regulator